MKPLRSGLASTCLLLAACVSHSVETEPIEIKPIHITMDINLKVQRELDQFFDFEEEVDPERAADPSPTPGRDSTRESDTRQTPSRSPR